jgi:hypothetical protein
VDTEGLRLQVDRLRLDQVKSQADQVYRVAAERSGIAGDMD